MRTLIAQGAEAMIYRVEEHDKVFLVKERDQKVYRLKELDEKIRKLRTRREVNILERAAKVIPVPKIIINGKEEAEKKIAMEFIPGQKLADVLNTFTEAQRINVCEQIGEQLARLHNEKIIHGDLTTSNMIFQEGQVYFIDFGLSFIDQKAEHKAVDLHLLKQALESKHYQHFEQSFAAVLRAYERTAANASLILERLAKVEKRGHYKQKNVN